MRTLGLFDKADCNEALTFEIFLFGQPYVRTLGLCETADCTEVPNFEMFSLSRGFI